MLTVSVELLIGKLASKGFDLFRQHEKLKAGLMTWKGMLRSILAVLADAKNRQKKDQSVTDWLDDLQNFAYDVEDILDEFQTEVLRRELLLQEPASPTCCTNFSPRSIQFESKMVLEMKKFTARLKAIKSNKEPLNLKNEISGGKSGNFRQPTTSLVDEAEVYAREKEEDEIVELLLRDDLRADDGFSVISINYCDSLVSFPQVALPSQLRSVKIDECNALESLTEAWMRNSDSSLQSLKIWYCKSLVSFPEVALPSQLRTVRIAGCDALKSSPEAWMQNSNTSLESLEIRSCDSLKYIARIQLPPSLKRVII